MTMDDKTSLILKIADAHPQLPYGMVRAIAETVIRAGWAKTKTERETATTPSS